MSPEVKRIPVKMTPRQGCMAIGEWVTRLIERKTGVQLWDGPDGIGGLLDEKLTDWGVPVSIELDPHAVSPRGLAETAGIVRRHKKRRVTR